MKVVYMGEIVATVIAPLKGFLTKAVLHVLHVILFFFCVSISICESNIRAAGILPSLSSTSLFVSQEKNTLFFFIGSLKGEFEQSEVEEYILEMALHQCFTEISVFVHSFPRRNSFKEWQQFYIFS